MSNEPTTNEATEEESVSTEEPTPTAETVEAPEEEEQEGSGHEAARYRRRLRDTEQERDTLRGQVENLQRAEVERLAGRGVVAPAGLWAAGVELADLLDDTGTVDPVKVDHAVVQAKAELGLAPKLKNYVPREGSVPASPRGGGFEDSLA